MSGQWSGDEIAEMRRLAADGLSAGQLAEALGRTRNAVIGKCDREGITLHLKRWRRPNAPAPAKPPRERRVNIVRPPAAPAKPVRVPAVATPVAIAAGAPQADAPPPGVALLDAGSFQCRWIIGEVFGADTRVCGCPVWRESSSWCATHYRVVFMRRTCGEAAA